MAVKAIDYLNYYLSLEGKHRWGKFHEEEGVACQLTVVYIGGIPYCPPQEMIGLMDEGGVERVFLANLLMFSYLHQKVFETCTNDEMAEVVTKYPGRFFAYVSYNPFKVRESVRALEKYVENYGFKGAFIHILDLMFHLTIGRCTLFMPGVWNSMCL